MKARTITISDKVINGCVTIQVNSNFEKFSRFILANCHESEKDEHKNQLPNHQHANGLCVPVKNKHGQQGYLIWIRAFDWSVRSMGVLTHELTHYIMRQFEQSNIPVRLENDEIFAYFLEYYQREAFWRLRKFAPDLKKKIKHKKHAKV